jgi:5'-methylthioadenosine phosphorylase
MTKIGIILGVEVDLNHSLTEAKEHFLDTPYGKPSAKIITGKIKNTEVVILRRNGKDDETPAFMVNYKANIFAMNYMGCSHILATSVCASLQEEIEIGEFVVFDQFIDLTTHREMTYSDKMDLAKLTHSAFNKPFSDDIRNCLIETAVIKGYTIHTKGTVLAVDGPRQSTRAESNLFRKWGADVVTTTTASEAILSFELGIEYGAISLCTYFDTWRTDIEPATRKEKNEVVEANKGKLIELLLAGIEKIGE